MVMSECCGTCAFNRYSDGEFVCGNSETEAYGCPTAYSDSCEEYEEK